MKIGTTSIKKMGEDTSIFSCEINNVSKSGGIIYIQLEGFYYSNLPFHKNELYEIQVNLDNQSEVLNFRGVFNDYAFNAGHSTYFDIEGKIHEGVVTLNNCLQFLEV